MAKPYNDKKLGLGEPTASMLKDFCAANYGAPAINIIRDAVQGHIENRLENSEMKERYESARKERLGITEKIVQLVDKNKP